MQHTKPAILLLSGGIDSATAGAMARRDGFELHALSIRYGQRHGVEIEAARRVAAWLGVKNHVELDLDLRGFGGSALTADIDVPKNRSAAAMAHDIPVTYVPARNTIFLSVALGWAEALGAADIFIGVNALDYSGYPDCRPEFISAFESMAQLATKAGVEGSGSLKINTPLIAMTKADIIRTGTLLHLDYGMTISCYDPTPDGKACGQCDSCLLRKKGFQEAGVPDPTSYSTLPRGEGPERSEAGGAASP
jgi:7-cyano-7-deazaguanine synthase